MRIEENARSRSLQKKEEESVTIGSHPIFPKEPGPSDQTEAVRGLPSGKAKEKSRNDLDRSFRWTRGSQEISSAFRGSGVHRAKNNDNENPEIARREIAK
jgi:hypothetical protein